MTAKAILSKACSIVIEDFLARKKKASTGGLLICLLGIIFLAGIFSTNSLSSIISLILLSLVIGITGLVIATGFWITPTGLSYVARFFWRIWLAAWGEGGQGNFIVYDASKIIEPSSVKFRKILIGQIKPLIERLNSIPVEEQDWGKKKRRTEKYWRTLLTLNMKK